MKKITGIIISSLSILILVLSIYIIVGSTLAVQNNQLFRLFGYSYAVVPTSSMEGDQPDNFNAGDAVIIFNTPFEDLKIGDIVVYTSDIDSRFIIHRIVDETLEGFIVKGDNNDLADTQIVNQTTYQGKYFTHFKFLNIGLWLSDFRMIILGGISIILFLTILYQFFKIVWDYKKSKLEATVNEKEQSLGDEDNER